jgi:hypothetical protein
MKKIISMLFAVFALAAISNETQAQIKMYRSTNGLQSGITTLRADTLTNADSTWFVVPAGQLGRFKSRNLAFYFTLDTTSGGGAGNVVQQGSWDGVTWFNLSGGAGAFAASQFSGQPLGVDGNNCDTLTWAAANLTNKVNKCYTMGGTGKFVYATTVWNLASFVPYARLKFVSQATQTTRIYDVNCVPF